MPLSPMGPHSAHPPVTAALATSSSGPGPLSESLTDPLDIISRFDAEEIWPLLGPREEGDLPSPPSPTGTPTTPSHLEAHGSEPQPSAPVVDGVGLVELYAGLRQGTSVKQWYGQHSRALANIDIRRFITFGVIKGFLYRVHKYAIATGQPAPAPRGLAAGALYTSTGPSSRATTGNNTPYAASSVGDDAPIAAAARREGSRERAASLHSASRSAGGPGSVPSGLEEEVEMGEGVDDRVLERLFDGEHCFDQICTELEVSERELTARLKRFPGEVLIIHR